MSDNPEDLTYCAHCGKPIYEGQGTVRSPRHDGVLHAECLFKLWRGGRVTVEEDEHGDAYFKIDVTEDLDSKE